MFSYPIPGEDGKPIGVIEYLKEVTARVRAERALKESNALLERRVQERTLKLQASLGALKMKNEALVRHKNELARLNLSPQVPEARAVAGLAYPTLKPEKG